MLAFWTEQHRLDMRAAERGLLLLPHTGQSSVSLFSSFDFMLRPLVGQASLSHSLPALGEEPAAPGAVLP